MAQNSTVRSSHDILIFVFLVSFNGSEPPELGDRVVNLYATGVPFGLRGTIVAIHSNTGYTEVNIFVECI